VFTDMIDMSLTPEMVLGRASGGGDCPVCGGSIAGWVRDGRGALVDHAGRAYPCRVPARWEPLWEPEDHLAYLVATDVWGGP
jgi:hypothetical protein